MWKSFRTLCWLQDIAVTSGTRLNKRTEPLMHEVNIYCNIKTFYKTSKAKHSQDDLLKSTGGANVSFRESLFLVFLVLFPFPEGGSRGYQAVTEGNIGARDIHGVFVKRTAATRCRFWRTVNKGLSFIYCCSSTVVIIARRRSYIFLVGQEEETLVLHKNGNMNMSKFTLWKSKKKTKHCKQPFNFFSRTSFDLLQTFACKRPTTV